MNTLSPISSANLYALSMPPQTEAALPATQERFDPTSERVRNANPHRPPSVAMLAVEYMVQETITLTAASTTSVYANLYKDGRQVGSLGNDGSATLGSGTVPDIDWEGGPTQGPALAQWRAEQMAKLGYQVIKADTALTPETWTLPPTAPNSSAIQAYIASRLAEWETAFDGQ